jgi:hypothetical protein
MIVALLLAVAGVGLLCTAIAIAAVIWWAGVMAGRVDGPNHHRVNAVPRRRTRLRRQAGAALAARDQEQ